MTSSSFPTKVLKEMVYNTLEIKQNQSLVRIALNRPKVMNALNEEMIRETTHAFDMIGKDDSVRVIVLEGNGKTFSAGADLSYMKQSGEMNIDQNTEQGIRLGNMYRSIERCPKPVIAKAHGYAIGGGFGFMVLADIAIAETQTKFALSEVKLGMNPAVIGPFVVKRIGLSHFKSLGITGEMIDSNHALRIGLIHEISDKEGLENAVMKKVNILLKGGPNAIAEFKANFDNMDRNEAAARIAKLRASDEGQEGLSAFLEKRPPNWVDSIG